MKIRGSALFVLYNVAGLQKFDLNGNAVTPWTQYGIQTDMASTGIANPRARNFRFDSNGNIYVAYSNTAIIAKYNQNLQPLWAYYFEEISLGDGLYSAGTKLKASGIDLAIDNQDRIFLSTTRSSATSMAASSAQGFLEISVDGALVNARTMPRASTAPLSTGVYYFAEQKQEQFDATYIPVFQVSYYFCYGYLQKSGQVGSWEIQAPPTGAGSFVINQPNFERSFALAHSVNNQFSNQWTVYSPGHELTFETVTSALVPSSLGFSFSYRSQTGVITS
jgi:hypothetical protein